MQARKRWRLPDEIQEESPSGWRRADGTIDLHQFKPEYLENTEECASLTAELDQSINYFWAILQGFAEDFRRSGIPTDSRLYGSTRRLWTLAKVQRNAVQDRRGELRRAKNREDREAADIRSERRFVEVAKRILSREQYMAIWEVANSLETKVEQSSNNPGVEGNGL